MRTKIKLTKEELDYLINNLLKNNNEILSKLIFTEENNNMIYVELEVGTADDIRELASNNVALHFDENYEPTEEGWVLERFIDKFYIGNG